MVGSPQRVVPPRTLRWPTPDEAISCDWSKACLLPGGDEPPRVSAFVARYRDANLTQFAQSPLGTTSRAVQLVDLPRSACQLRHEQPLAGVLVHGDLEVVLAKQVLGRLRYVLVVFDSVVAGPVSAREETTDEHSIDGISPGPRDTRVIAMAGPSDTILKARLSRQPSHPRALPTLLEAIALWQASDIHAALCAADRAGVSESSLYRDAFVDFGGRCTRSSGSPRPLSAAAVVVTSVASATSAICGSSRGDAMISPELRARSFRLRESQLADTSRGNSRREKKATEPALTPPDRKMAAGASACRAAPFSAVRDARQHGSLR
jgi:hypothetical protein